MTDRPSTAAEPGTAAPAGDTPPDGHDLDAEHGTPTTRSGAALRAVGGWCRRHARPVIAVAATLALTAAVGAATAAVTAHHESAYRALPAGCGWVNTAPLHTANPAAGTVTSLRRDLRRPQTPGGPTTLSCFEGSSSDQAWTGLQAVAVRYDSARQAAHADAVLRGHRRAASSVPMPDYVIYGLDADPFAASNGPWADLDGVGGQDAWVSRHHNDPWEISAWTSIGVHDHNLLLLVAVQMSVPEQSDAATRQLWAATRVAATTLPHLQQP